MHLEHGRLPSHFTLTSVQVSHVFLSAYGLELEMCDDADVDAWEGLLKLMSFGAADWKNSVTTTGCAAKFNVALPRRWEHILAVLSLFWVNHPFVPPR